MASYKVQVVAPDGGLIVGVTLNCPDDPAALQRFETLPLPDGEAVLTLGERVVVRRGPADASRARATG